MLESVKLSNFDNLVNEASEKLYSLQNRLPIDPKIIGNPDASLPQDVPVECGIYAIWVNDELKYIGTVRREQGLRGRLTEHLIKCPKRTQSKLEKVKESVRDGRMISISFIHVEPEPFRLALEDELIRRARGDGLAEWNQKSIK